MNDGGPAFPRPASGLTGMVEQQTGMSLRDWFAGQALTTTASGSYQSIANYCYKVADAMLAERDKDTTPTKEPNQ